MKYTSLGRTGVKISRLCFGTMSFGQTSDEQASKELFHRCLDAGINFFDCANGYADGDSERILGRLIQGHRDELILTTKVAAKVGEGVNDRGLSRRHIRQQIEASLKRLGTDYIDVYFVHHFDEDTPIAETLRALDDLVKEGRVLYLGVSNWAAWQIATALGVSAKEQLARFQVVQPMYSLIKRQAEVEILPLAAAEGLSVTPYSPLGAGLLTGKYAGGKRPDSGRIVESDMYAKRYADGLYHQVAESFAEHANAKGIHPATLAVAWVMANPAVSAPIIGARNVAQLEPSLASVDVDMTPEWWQEISELSYQPPPATDRTETQVEPVSARR